MRICRAVFTSEGRRRGPLGARAANGLTAGLMLGLLLSALDTMIMASATRSIADQLDGLTLQAWVTTAYLVTTVISTPLYGKLSDVYGRRPLYTVSIGIFLAGSVLCGFATSMPELAAFRAVQGLGAGGLISLSYLILADVLPPAERARRQAYLSSAFMIATVVGPVVGGFFAAHDGLLGLAGWRWAFLVNVPVGLASLVLVRALLGTSPRQAGRRLDVGGAAALVVGIVPLLVVVERGARWGWTSSATLACGAAGVAGLAVFARVERQIGREALLPMYLLRHRLLGLLNALSVLIGMAVFAGLTVLPLYLQIVKGLGPIAAGLALVPQAIAIFASARLVSPLVVRTQRYRGLLVIGVSAMTAASVAYATVGVGTPLWLIALLTALMGAGIGCCFEVKLQAMQGNVPRGDLGAAVSAQLFFQRIGGTVGTAVFLALLFGLADDRIAGAFRTAASSGPVLAAMGDPAVAATPANAPILAGLNAREVHVDLDDSSFLARLDPRLARPILEGFTSSMRAVYATLACLLLAALALALLVPRTPPPRSEVQ